jgi:hypothetical protein
VFIVIQKPNSNKVFLSYLRAGRVADKKIIPVRNWVLQVRESKVAR